jgi:hypothetical protein
MVSALHSHFSASPDPLQQRGFIDSDATSPDYYDARKQTLANQPVDGRRLNIEKLRHRSDTEQLSRHLKGPQCKD